MTTTTILCFFFNDTATTEIYTLSLHDALPISHPRRDALAPRPRLGSARRLPAWERPPGRGAGRGGGRRRRADARGRRPRGALGAPPPHAGARGESRPHPQLDGQLARCAGRSIPPPDRKSVV